MTVTSMAKADDARRGISPLDRVVSENFHTLSRRAGISQRGLVIALEMSQPTLSRRVSCESAWLMAEVVRAAHFFCVSLEEMTSALPSLGEWEGRWVVRHQGLEPRTRCLRALPGGRVGDKAAAGRPLLRVVAA